VEGGTCVFGGDVKVRGSIGRDDERESFCVELDCACDEVGIAGGDVVGMSYAGDAPLFFQSEESPRDRRKGDAESFGEGGRIHFRGCRHEHFFSASSQVFFGRGFV
jgi:hypothetical protein